MFGCVVVHDATGLAKAQSASELSNRRKGLTMATGMRRLVGLCGRPRCLHVLRNANAVVIGDRVAEEGDATC